MKDEIGNYEITFTEKPTAAEVGVLTQGLHTHINGIFGESWARSIAYLLRDGDGVIVGGAYGSYGSFRWAFVDTLWVADHVRGHGYGSRLLAAFEQEAAKNHCTDVYLDTFSFQAPEFYKRLGYEIFGELNDFPPGHSRIFLRKSLISATDTTA